MCLTAFYIKLFFFKTISEKSRLRSANKPVYKTQMLKETIGKEMFKKNRKLLVTHPEKSLIYDQKIHIHLYAYKYV